MTPRHCRLCDHVMCTCCATGHGYTDCPGGAHCIACIGACPDCSDRAEGAA